MKVNTSAHKNKCAQLFLILPFYLSSLLDFTFHFYLKKWHSVIFLILPSVSSLSVSLPYLSLISQFKELSSCLLLWASSSPHFLWHSLLYLAAWKFQLLPQKKTLPIINKWTDVVWSDGHKGTRVCSCQRCDKESIWVIFCVVSFFCTSCRLIDR